MYKAIPFLLILTVLVAIFANVGVTACADDGSQSKKAEVSLWTQVTDAFQSTFDNMKGILDQDRTPANNSTNDGQGPADNQAGNNPPPGNQGGQGNPEQQAQILARASEILGISSDQLTAAYETAKKSVEPSAGNSGAPQGRQLHPPSDNTMGSNPPPPPPSDNTTGGNPPPPLGGQGKAHDMPAIYSKVAETLGLPVDNVSAAFEEARQELGPNNGQNPGPGNSNNPQNGGQSDNITAGYSLDQAMSDKAQLSTIAFSGLAFITGSAGADTFFPPGKVADFFGFQYMRDVDTAGYGHNTTFLSKAANNVLKILTDDQNAKLIALAKEQEPIYTNFAYNRFPLMAAFRSNLEGKLPSGATGLSQDAVKAYVGNLYNSDAQLSYRRAEVVGSIIASFTPDQKAYLANMQFNNSATWPDVAEDQTIKTNLTNTQFVAVMTYASELFSWYKGDVNADIYFCPERHGTYFGGFFMKDYAAMNNPDYFISTSTTGDKGQAFLDALNGTQRQLITSIIDEQRGALKEIAAIRTTVSTELRKAMAGQSMDKDKVYSLIKRYGELDGQLSGLYASRFAEVNKTLTADQRATLVKLRDLTVVPQGAYFFSTPINYPALPNIDYLFGVGQAPANSGQLAAPAGFTTGTETNSTPPANQ